MEKPDFQKWTTLSANVLWCFNAITLRELYFYEKRKVLLVINGKSCQPIDWLDSVDVGENDRTLSYKQ